MIKSPIWALAAGALVAGSIVLALARAGAFAPEPLVVAAVSVLCGLGAAIVVSRAVRAKGEIDAERIVVRTPLDWQAGISRLGIDSAQSFGGQRAVLTVVGNLVTVRIHGKEDFTFPSDVLVSFTRREGSSGRLRMRVQRQGSVALFDFVVASPAAPSLLLAPASRIDELIDVLNSKTQGPSS